MSWGSPSSPSRASHSISSSGGPWGRNRLARKPCILCQALNHNSHSTLKGVCAGLFTSRLKPDHMPMRITIIAPNLPRDTLRNQAREAPMSPPPAPILAMSKVFSQGILMSCQRAVKAMSSIQSPPTGRGRVPSGRAILTREVSTTRKHKYMARSPVREAMRLAIQRVNVSAHPCPVGFEVDTPRAVTKNTPTIRPAIQGHLVGFESLALALVPVLCRFANGNPPRTLLYIRLGLSMCFSTKFPGSLQEFLPSRPKIPLGRPVVF